MSKNRDYTIELQEPPCKVSNDELETDPRDRVRWHHVSPQGETLETDACIVFETWPFEKEDEEEEDEKNAKERSIPFDRDENNRPGAGFTKWYKVKTKNAPKETHYYNEYCTKCDKVPARIVFAGARIIIR